MKKACKLPPDALEMVARRFKALSEPTRLRILQTIWDGECSVQDIVQQIQTSQVNVSKHLAILYDAGFVSRRKDGLFTFYRVTDKWVLQLCNLICDRVRTSLEDQVRTLRTP